MFKRMQEDFVCEHCGTAVVGNGYTNHCPQCLWSKHVDIDPGDRAAECKGMMRPMRVEGTATRFRILHRCERCGHEKMNDAADGDSPDALIAIAVARANMVS
jgi:rubrerythrin